MKKIFSVLVSVCCCLVLCLGLAGCGTVPVEEVKFDQNTINVSSGSSADLTYTVTPENGSLEFEVISLKEPSERIFTYKVKNGKVTIQAKSAGAGTLRIRAKSDETIYADCKVTVDAPSGYAVYRTNDVKLVYPLIWSQTTMPGVEVMFSLGASNFNLTSENINTTYFTANASAYKTTLETTYKLMGLSINDLECTVQKYDGGKAVRVNYKYSLAGKQTSQVQLARNSESKTYVLTITNATEEQIEIMQNEFYAW